jgi:hypothetical protein
LSSCPLRTPYWELCSGQISSAPDLKRAASIASQKAAGTQFSAGGDLFLDGLPDLRKNGPTFNADRSRDPPLHLNGTSPGSTVSSPFSEATVDSAADFSVIATLEAATASPAAPQRPHWTPLTRVGFRIAFLYFFCFLFLFGNGTLFAL